MTAGGARLPPLPASLDSLIGASAIEPVLAGEAGAIVLRLAGADGDIRFLKSGSGRVANDIADGMIRLRWLEDRLPAARVLHFAFQDGTAWLLTSGVAGRTGDAWLADSPDHLPAVIDGSARFLRRIHALPVADCPFDAGAEVRMAAARRNVTAGLVDVDDFDDDHSGWTAERVWSELVSLTPGNGERVVTHGDYSLGNLLLDADGEVAGVIDVGRLAAGDPYQDIAILWQNLADFGPAAQARFLQAYGIARPDERRLAFYRCLDELF